MYENYVGRKVMVVNAVFESKHYKSGDVFKVIEVLEEPEEINIGLVVDNGMVLLPSEVIFID